jgi:hypothetical protein
MFMWMLDAAALPPPDSATVCIRIAASVMPRPAPPTSVGDAEPAGARHRRVEIVREPAFAVLAQPVIVAEVRADLFDRRANGELIFGEREIHDRAFVM